MKPEQFRAIRKSGSLLILAGFLLIAHAVKASEKKNTSKHTSIADHLSNKTVHVLIKGLGHHSGRSFEIELNNLTSDTLFVLFEAGRRLVSTNSHYQDFLIVRENRITLPPSASVKEDGYGFCCESNDGSPPKAARFDIGYMAPAEWVKLAELINKNNFPEGAIQAAVWVLSDNHPISSIVHKDPKQIELLRRTVADIKKTTLPWYFTTYEKDSCRLFSGKAEKIFAEIEYYLNKNTFITIQVRTKAGRLLKTLIKEQPKGPGTYSYYLDLDVKNWPKDEYQLLIYEDGSNLKLKKTFEL